VPEVVLRLPRLHPAQEQIRHEARRFNVACTGRRSGKTVLAVDLLIERAVEGQPVAYYAPTYKNLEEVWQVSSRLLAPVLRRQDSQMRRLELVTGGVIEFWAIDLDGARKARGRKYGRIVVDEAALIANLVEQWEADLSPMLIDLRGDAWFFSTPRGYNDFFHLWERGASPAHGDWQAWKMATAVNPFIPPEEIERARLELDAATFAQEYLAEFTAPSGLVLGLDDDGVAIYEPTQNLRPAPCRWDECKWRFACIDPGGSDPTGLVALGVTRDDRFHVFGAERRTGNVALIAEDGDGLNDWLAGLHQAGPLTRIVVSETGGALILNTLRRLGWTQAEAFIKDRGLKLTTLRSLCKSRRLTFAPALKGLVESEVYTWMFAEAKVGRVGHQTWQTVVNTSAHHADVLEALADAVTSVQVRYPMVPGVVLRGRAHAVGVRRAV